MLCTQHLQVAFFDKGSLSTGILVFESPASGGALRPSSMSFRSQLQGFALGSAIVGAFAMYQLQKDVWSSHRMILAAVRFSAHRACTADLLLHTNLAYTTGKPLQIYTNIVCMNCRTAGGAEI